MPVIVTGVPAGPELGEALVMVGEAVTVNGEPLLWGSPGIVTTMLPDVPPLGTVTAMYVELQDETGAVVPFRVTPLVP